MRGTETLDELEIQASDVSGQKVVNVREVPSDATIGEVVRGLLAQMNLPENDAGGQPLVYQARLDREGRQLHASERAADALQSGDLLVLQPNIDAGGAGR